jgi:putative endonuclease
LKDALVKLGKHGEALAKEYLLKKGYEIVKENFRFERAETDIIVKDETKKILVFVEVKTRRNKKFGEPEEAVTEQKMQQLVKSAEGFLMNTAGYEDYDVRFDIIAILSDGKNETINHIENAI